jgi:hypothetical protein
MAEVTSGRNLTVLVLDEDEASLLGIALHEMMTDEGRVLVDEGPLYAIYDALYPTEEIE